MQAFFEWITKGGSVAKNNTGVFFSSIFTWVKKLERKTSCSCKVYLALSITLRVRYVTISNFNRDVMRTHNRWKFRLNKTRTKNCCTIGAAKSKFIYTNPLWREEDEPSLLYFDKHSFSYVKISLPTSHLRHIDDQNSVKQEVNELSRFLALCERWVACKTGSSLSRLISFFTQTSVGLIDGACCSIFILDMACDVCQKIREWWIACAKGVSVYLSCSRTKNFANFRRWQTNVCWRWRRVLWNISSVKWYIHTALQCL